MKRLFVPVVVAALLGGVAVAQEPAKERPKLRLELAGGEVVLMTQTRLRGEELCGQVFRKQAEPRPACIAKSQIESASFADPKALTIGAVRGALCVTLAPACYGRIKQEVGEGVRAKLAPK